MLVFLVVVVDPEVNKHTKFYRTKLIFLLYLAPGLVGAPGNPGQTGPRGLPGDMVCCNVREKF